VNPKSIPVKQNGKCELKIIYEKYNLADQTPLPNEIGIKYQGLFHNIMELAQNKVNRDIIVFSNSLVSRALLNPSF